MNNNIITDYVKFENNFAKTFGDINRNSLGSIKKNKIKIELGGYLTVSNRIEVALYRAQQILKFCLEKSSIWLRIILWDEKENENLNRANFKISQANLFFEEIVFNEKVWYVHLEKYNETFVNPIILSIINYEVNKEPIANITCYFINFSIPIILNIYDDRGMDVFSPNEILLKRIRMEYTDWII